MRESVCNMGILASRTFWTLFVLTTTTAAQSLPYNPTHILLPSEDAPNRDFAYIFRPQAAGTQHELLSLNISSNISTSKLSFTSLSTHLPFQGSGSGAYVPAISSAGDISVYAGSCASAPQLWRFTPNTKAADGNGTWKAKKIDGTTSVTGGASYLSRGITFSSFVNANASQTDIYVFGGMCPNGGSTPDTWQAEATYSNTMTQLGPSSDTEYTLSVPSSRGPPIAEAGFTLTGLTPTHSNRSGILTQQQNFVLLGGHTRSAFLNTSQVAIWSMPEESWSFVTISSTSTSLANTELTVKSTAPAIDSRSGHTAILTEDGTSMIVYGGWVGDVGQAADPQLAILRLGSGYGGEGEWQWVVPKEQPTESALYGHGAAMLPGNVMMVVGGYAISSSASKRQETSQARFWNATSMTWVTDYTSPTYLAALSKQEAKKDAASSKAHSRKLGLGLGIGLGLALLLVALLGFCWCVRKQRRKRDRREDDLNAIGEGQGVVYTPRAMQEREGGGFPWSHGGWNDRSREQPAYDSSSSGNGYENLDTGVHNLGNPEAYPPPPKQILRKPLHSRNARGAYQPAPVFDFNANNHGRANSLGTAGAIHPIYEADEEDQSRKSAEGIALAVEALSEKRRSDPFRDPPQQALQMPFRSDSLTETERSHRTRAKERELEIQEWVSDWAAAETLMNSQMRSHSNAGRISPTRRAQLIAASTISSMSGEEDSGRTASNLSEQSIAVSSLSISRSGSSSQGRSRNNSLRGFLNSAISPFSAAVPSSTAPSTVLAAYDTQHHQPPKSAGSGSSSFTTAKESFNGLQAQGDTLLPPPDDYWASGQSSPTRSQPESPGSPSKHKGGVGRSRNSAGWLGSIRRAFVGTSHDDIDFQSVPSRDTSPIRIDKSQNTAPRRTVSEGGTLWRRKQGKGDWEDSALDVPGDKGSRSNTFGNLIMPANSHRGSAMSGMTGISGITDDEDDWDIEQAVQNRVVQVMFTVPKEKLRVVNHDVRDDMSDIASLRSKQGSGKSTTGTTAQIEPVLERVVENPDTPQMNTYTLSDSPGPMFVEKGKEIERVSTPTKRNGKEREVNTEMGKEIERVSTPTKWKGKEREVDLVREMEKEVQKEMDAESPRRRELRKPKSRVLDMVESFEKRGSPER